VKVTLIVQLTIGASVDPQLFVWEKSPVFPFNIPIEPIINGADPVFVSVIGCGLLLVPVVKLPKLMLVLLRFATGVLSPTGVRKATICMIHWLAGLTVAVAA
jgi:hypothetical protein